jgi:hypothetical protein
VAYFPAGLEIDLLTLQVMRPGLEGGHPPQPKDTVKECLEIYLHCSLFLCLSITTRKDVPYVKCPVNKYTLKTIIIIIN